jgi:NADPH:quinone reductase-like Zn-dependent oxidoreductase
VSYEVLIFRLNGFGCHYFSGEVIQVGSQVKEYAVGDQIYGAATLKMGAYAEYLSLPADCSLVHKPSNLSYAEAAAVPLGGLNAFHFMNKAEIKHGDSVLINGAGGSIGLFALQIAKQRGAQVTVVDKGSKQAMLVSKGADRFINYTLQDFSLEGHEYDVVFDMVAQSSFAKCLSVVKPGGRLLLGNPSFPKMLKSAWVSRTTDKFVSFAFAKESKDELTALNELLEAGKIAPVIDRVFSMDEAVQAHHRVQDEERVGMVILSMEKEGS